MLILQWRHFNFIDITPIKDPAIADDGALFSDPGLTAICPARKSVFFATTNSVIREFDQDLQLTHSFTAYEPGWTVSFLRYLSGTSLLLSIGELIGTGPIIKLWNLDKRDKKTNDPNCHTIVHVSNGDNTFPISAFDISSDLNIIALGFADGAVVLVRGDIIHDRGSRQRLVYDSSGPITGIHFHDKDGIPTLFVATVSKILTVSTSGKNNGKPEKVLEKAKGADLGCTAYDPHTNMFVVGREDSISFYQTSSRGPSFVFEIPKKQIFCYKQYIVMVSASNNPTTGTSSYLNDLLGGVTDYSTSRLLIVDSANKYIAYSGQISQGVKDIFVQWDRLYVLGTDGVLYQFDEKDLQTRLNILTQRNLYDVAIQLGKSLDIDRDIILKIERAYGDYLYNNGELTDALTHFIECIDLGNTSQIILKYRESQYIHNLTTYLEALHDRGLALKEHTTLLLNSYAKLKDDEKLKQFIENDDNSTKFDFETAIQICRQSEYYTLASYLATKMGESQLVVQIKLKDLHDYKGCLAYVRSLPVDDALRNLIQNSRILLNEFPNQTTLLLIDLFTGKYTPKDAGEKGKDDSDSDLQEESYLTRPVLQSYRAFVSYMSTAASIGSGPSEPEALDTKPDYIKPTYQPPRPRLIFSSFVDHPNEFVIFLEACLEAYDEFDGNEKDKKDLLSTLFEMYLNLANRTESEEEKKEWESKAQQLGLESKSTIDASTILLLSHLNSFQEGQILTHQQEGFQIDMFRSCVASGDVKGAVDVLHKYGDEEKELYPLALTFFTSTKEILDQVGPEFNFVLNKIRDEKLMAPLQVVQALSVNSVATVGLVKSYLIDIIEREKVEIDNNLKLSESYRSETKAKQIEINKLANDPMVVQYSVCSSCKSSLDLPAVHFACKHSYHQRCLNCPDESNPQCPVCLPDMEAIAAIRRGQDDASDRYDLFKLALDSSDSKFKVVTDFFGRGAMEQARYILR